MNSSKSALPCLQSLRRARFERLFSFLSVCLGCSILPGWPVSSADGELDLTFEPDASYSVDAIGLGVEGGKYYFTHLSGPVRRLLADGSLDPEWIVEVPLVQLITEFRRTPWGGWVFRDFGNAFIDTGNGAPHRIGYPGAAGSGVQRLFPQADGWVVFGQPLSRVSVEGTMDLAYGSDAHYVGASFTDGAGTTLSGGPHTTAIQDDLERFIVAGNLKQVGKFERLGLARILPNGRVDPDWNVAPKLGIELDDEGNLNALPISLVAAPENGLVVGLQLVSSDGEPDFGFAVLDGSGEVIATFPNPGLPQPTIPVVQPDGRILMGGTVNADPNTPVAAVIRLNVDGSVDATFDVGISSASGWVQIWSLELDEIGRLWIAGSFDAVDGVPRAGLARVQAYEPVAEAPELGIAYHQPRVDIGEFLDLTARVRGVPEPELQWYLNGEELPGQVHPGLRILVEGAAQVGDYSVVATNPEGSEELDFAPVTLAERSPRPGVIDPSFQRSLAEFPSVLQLLTLADGSVLVGGGDIYAQTDEPRAMVGKLGMDGDLDLNFGTEGVVKGDGFVESLRLLADGGILVAGQFTQLDGVPATGLAELDAEGRLVVRDWPALDVAHVSTVLRRSDGGYILAGGFTTVAGSPAYRLARLYDDLTLDETFGSPLETWQFVDDVQLDSEGRLLIAGERIYATGLITNPPPLGLQRLLEDGSPDPGFQRFDRAVRSVVVEPGGTLLTLTQAGLYRDGYIAPCRLNADGGLLVEFELTGFVGREWRPRLPDHRMLQFPDGSVVGVFSVFGVGDIGQQLIRWHSDGERDGNFSSRIGSNPGGPAVQAIALLPDGGLLVSTLESSTLSDPLPPEQARRLLRIPPDSDSELEIANLGGGELSVRIATQPGRTYQIRSRTNLSAGEPVVVGEIDGDGYKQERRIASDGSALFLDYVARRDRP